MSRLRPILCVFLFLAVSLAVLPPAYLAARSNPTASRDASTALLRQGNKIGAIKLFRETFGTGLKEAKDSVEQMQTGQPVVYTQGNYQGANPAFQAFPQAYGSQPFIPGQAVQNHDRALRCRDIDPGAQRRLRRRR